ncbi:MAG: hypothetical protein C4531_03410, partial [Desulfurivibrio sp.]
MIKRTALLMTTAFMFVTLPGAAVADDQDQYRDKDQDRDHICWPDNSQDISGRFDLAADRTQDRDNDGICDGDGPDQDRDGWN